MNSPKVIEDAVAVLASAALCYRARKLTDSRSG